MKKFALFLFVTFFIYLGLSAMMPIDNPKFPSHVNLIANTSTPSPIAIQNSYNGLANQVTGVSSGTFSFTVDQQPNGDPGYVTSQAGHVSQFSIPKKYGVIGILAHNNYAGASFFDLKVGDTASVLYGDGHTRTYKVFDIEHYQALDPESVYSTFVDLNTGYSLSANDLFRHVYTAKGTLVFQTCIKRNGDWSWGRQFILADPL